MKKYIYAIGLLVLLGYAGTFIGWWGLLIVAAVVGFVFQMHGLQSFLIGMIGGALFFGIYAYWLDLYNESQLSTKMAALLKFDAFLPTLLIGALLGGLGMLCGKYCRDLFFGEQKKNRYRGKYS